VAPALATRWRVSPDGLVWTFTLREGVRFHDGTPLGAAEVAASLERLRAADPQRPSPVWSALLRGTPGVVRTVRAVEVALVQPYAPLLTVLAHPGLGIVRQAAAPDGTVRLVGSGPYRVAEIAPGRLVLEAANPWAAPPRTPRLVFLDVDTEERAEAELAAGGLDIWFPPGPPRRGDWAVSIPGLRVGYLAFQTEKEPFSRKKIRHAVAAALDPAVIGIALGRAAVPLQSFLPPGVWARREGSPILGGTRRAALKLLAEGGWPRGFTPTLLVANDLPDLDL